jgi:alpha-beta hydrolase superfamily lysophospholipase
MSILDHPLITERYFFPRHYPVPDPTWVDVEGARLACNWSRGNNPFTVVHFHGNGEVVADYVPDFPEWMLGLGADCFLAEYRGYGESSGTPRLGRMLDDVPAIYETINRPPEELIVFGRSVGSIYAIEFAARYPDVAGLILESGIADPLERILMRVSPNELSVSVDALKAAFSARLDNLEKLHGRRNPTLVLHARNDSLVDVSHAVRLASSPAENVRLVLFQDGDHNTIFNANRDRYTEEVAQLLSICERDGGYGMTAAREPRNRDEDDTLEVELEELESTEEYGTPALDTKRTGPGQTKELDVPDVLRPTDRNGPGETFEYQKPRDLDD